MFGQFVRECSKQAHSPVLQIIVVQDVQLQTGTDREESERLVNVSNVNFKITTHHSR